MNGSQREVLCSWFSGIELASPSLPAGTSSPVPPHPPIGAFYALPSHTASCSFKRHTLATGRAVPTCHSPLSLLPACCLQGPSFPRWPFLCLQSWPWPERMHAEATELTSPLRGSFSFRMSRPDLAGVEILLDHPVPVLGRGVWAWKSSHTLSQLQKENPWRSLEISIQPSHSEARIQTRWPPYAKETSSPLCL